MTKKIVLVFYGWYMQNAENSLICANANKYKNRTQYEVNPVDLYFSLGHYFSLDHRRGACAG